MSIINGSFNPKDAIEILTRIIHIKIEFHEAKIHNSQNEEDIKMREKRIKELQNYLFEMRSFIQQQPQKITINCSVELTS